MSFWPNAKLRRGSASRIVRQQTERTQVPVFTLDADLSQPVEYLQTRAVRRVLLQITVADQDAAAGARETTASIVEREVWRHFPNQKVHIDRMEQRYEHYTNLTIIDVSLIVPEEPPPPEFSHPKPYSPFSIRPLTPQESTDMPKETSHELQQLKASPKYANYTSIEFRQTPLDRVPNDWVYLGTEEVNGSEFAVYGRDMEQSIVKVVQERDQALAAVREMSNEDTNLRASLTQQRAELERRNRRLRTLEDTNKSLAELLGQTGAKLRPPNSEDEEKASKDDVVEVDDFLDFEASL